MRRPYQGKMNKLLIVLLAICLVSVQVNAFVRRDTAAEVDKPDPLKNIQDQFMEFTQGVKEKLQETFNPDNISKGFNDALESVQKTINDIKEKTQEKPKA